MNTVKNRYMRGKKQDMGGQYQDQTWREFNRCLKNKNLYLFGAGLTCDEFLNKYGKRYYVKGIYDNNECLWGQSYRQLPVCKPEELNKCSSEKVILLITSTKYDEAIGSQLKSLGIRHVFSVYAMEIKRLKYRIGNPFYWLYHQLFAYHFGIFSSHGILNNYVFFHIMAILRICRFPPAFYPYKGMLDYKNIYTKKRCFIVATGPSLTIEDIELLNKNNEITFSMNSIMNLFGQTGWRPDYYVIEDPKFNLYFDWEDEQYNLDLVCKKTAFLPYLYRKTCKKFQKAQFYPISYLGHLVKHDDTRMLYSDNWIWGIYCAYTVTNVCIQLAQYMGFSEIYLLGVDCNYMGPQKHFSQERDDSKYSEKYAREAYENMLRGFTFMRKKTEARGVKIYNATRGGLLEVFERVDLDQLF